MTFRNIWKVHVIMLISPEYHSCKGGMADFFGSVLAGGFHSAGICHLLNIRVDCLHSRLLGYDSECSHAHLLSKSLDEGNDPNRESHKGHAADYFLDNPRGSEDCLWINPDLQRTLVVDHLPWPRTSFLKCVLS